MNKALDVGTKALRIATGVASLLNVEKKFHDPSVLTAPSNFDHNGRFHLLNDISPGDAGNQRDGDQVKLTKVYWKATIRNMDTTAPHIYRFSIILDKQTSSGIAPTDAELHQAVQEPRSPLNMSNKMRFKVLHDQFFFLEPAPNAGEGSRSYKILEGYLDLQKKFAMSKGLRTMYPVGVGGSTPSSNALWVCIWSDSAVPTDSILEPYFRVRFIDN